KFRGVQIGSVTDIRFRLAEVTAVSPEEFRIPVWFAVDLKQLSDLRGGRPVRLDRARIDQLIAQGLRAQLQTDSFVTGVLFVGLDFFPGSPIALVHGDRPDILEIPTMPTALERASQTISKLAARIENLDIEGLVRSVTEAVDGVNALVRSPEVARTITAAREALVSVRQLGDSLTPGVVVSSCMLGRGSDPTRFYVLTATVPPSSSAPGSLGIGLGPIAMPGYLRRPMLVTRIDGTQVRYADFERWADPLPALFARALGQDLSTLLDGARIVPYPWYPTTPLDIVVLVDVGAFEADVEGNARLEACWTIR